MQSAACNAFHSIPERAARWLLHAQDRAGDRIELTQEALPGLLGVQRTTVNAVIRTLQDEGLMSIGRGVIRVADRAGLKRRACECYQRLEDHFGGRHRDQRDRQLEAADPALSYFECSTASWWLVPRPSPRRTAPRCRTA